MYEERLRGGGLFPLLLGPEIIMKVFNMVKISNLIDDAFYTVDLHQCQCRWS